MIRRLNFAAALSRGCATGADAACDGIKVDPNGTCVVGGSSRTGCK